MLSQRDRFMIGKAADPIMQKMVDDFIKEHDRDPDEEEESEMASRAWEKATEAWEVHCDNEVDRMRDERR